MHTLSTLVVKVCQDGKIASCWSWHCYLWATSRQSVASQSSMSLRLVAEDFIAKVFMKSACDRSTTVQWLVCDLAPTSRKPLQLVRDRNQLQLVFCACLKDWLRMILYGDRSPTLPRPLQNLYNCHFFTGGKVAVRSQALWGQGFRRITCSTMYKKAPFARLARTGVRKISSVACGFSPIKVHFSE